MRQESKSLEIYLSYHPRFKELEEVRRKIFPGPGTFSITLSGFKEPAYGLIEHANVSIFIIHSPESLELQLEELRFASKLNKNVIVCIQKSVTKIKDIRGLLPRGITYFHYDALTELSSAINSRLRAVTQKTPREEMEDVSTGKSEPHHIGPKSKEVLIQEIWSLDNTKPEFRKSDWYTQRKNLIYELKGKYGLDYSIDLWRSIFKSKSTIDESSIQEDAQIVGSPFISNDTWTSEDQLGYSIIAHAIYKFLTHENTVAPFTVSIHAPWGGGKTSLMKMIQHKLDPTVVSEIPEEPHDDMSHLTFNEILKEIENKEETPLNFQIEPGQKLTVWFNAWKYENSEQVWAGLADAIIRQITGRLSKEDRTKFWIRVNKDRLKSMKIKEKIKGKIFDEWSQKAIKWILTAIAGGGASAIAFFLDQPIVASTGILIAAVGGITTTIKEFLQTESEIKNEAATQTYQDFFRIPDYSDKLGLAHTIEQDIRKILEPIPKEYLPIVVFIDDLDRCPETKVAEVIEALNRFISASIQNCVFIIGMDATMIATALERVYSSQIKSLETKFANETLGWKFMDKFIQLPITLPSPHVGYWNNYLNSILEVKGTEESYVDRDGESVESPKNMEPTFNPEPPPESKPIEITEKENKEIESILGDDKQIMKHCQKLVNDFAGNPRVVKRIVNLIRFHTAHSYLRTSKKLPIPGIDDIVNWTKFSLKWPAVESWVTRGSWETAAKIDHDLDITKINNRFTLLERIAKDPQNWEKNLKILLETNDTKDVPWVTDNKLRKFFEANNLSQAAGRGLY